MDSPPSFEKKGPDGYTDKQPKDLTSRWKVVQTAPNQTTITKDNSKNEHTDWKEAHKGIPDDAVAKRKREGRCTHCTLTNHIWRKCRKEAGVASAFINQKGRIDRNLYSNLAPAYWLFPNHACNPNPPLK